MTTVTKVTRRRGLVRVIAVVGGVLLLGVLAGCESPVSPADGTDSEQPISPDGEGVGDDGTGDNGEGDENGTAPSARTIAGIVRVQETEAEPAIVVPVAGATVEAYRGTDLLVATTTGADGAFELSVTDPETVHIAVAFNAALEGFPWTPIPIVGGAAITPNQDDRAAFTFDTQTRAFSATAPDVVDTSSLVIYGTLESIAAENEETFLVASTEQIHAISEASILDIDDNELTIFDRSFLMVRDIDTAPIADWVISYEPVSIFSGIFDGGGFTIDGFAITAGQDATTGLFGEIKNAEVRILTLTDLSLDVEDSGNSRGGGLAGVAISSIIQNVSVAGSVTGSKGASSGTSSSVGGVVGRIEETVVTNVHFTGAINSPSDQLVGGLMGTP